MNVNVIGNSGTAGTASTVEKAGALLRAVNQAQRPQPNNTFSNGESKTELVAGGSMWLPDGTVL